MNRLMTVLSLLGSMLLADAADAACYKRVVYRRILVQKVLPVPVAIPAATFVNMAPAVSPITATISPQYLQEVQQKQANEYAQVMVQKEQELLARLARIEQMLAGHSNEDLPPSIYTDQPNGNAPPPVNGNGQGATIRPHRGDLIRTVGILQGKCAQCHTGAKSRGNVQLFDDAGGFHPNVSARVIMDAVTRPMEDGRPKMPQGPNKLSPEERAEIAAWAQ